MKTKIILAAVLALCLTAGAAPVHAASLGPGDQVSYTLLSGVTATGTPGTAVPFVWDWPSVSVPVPKHMCAITWAGTAPTNVVVEFDCSHDGTNYGDCATVTATASPTIFHVDKPGIRYARGTYQQRTGGDGTTAVTMTCTGHR